MKLKLILLSSCLILIDLVYGQHLQAGFDKKEYTELLKMAAQYGDSAYRAAIPPSPQYKFVYRSDVTGLDNRWTLWMREDGVPLISIRGTTTNEISWLANFYAAMVPAKGELKIAENETFTYEVASNPRAAIHVGWLISTAFLSKTIIPKIDSLYRTGARYMLIEGTSQGGAIAFLLTAYLHYLQVQNKLSADIRFKTYCTAAPKPGNLYFAYDYEAATQGGWAYNIVNSADWVPQSPFSVQNVSDFNAVNPFINAKAFIKKQGWPKRWALNYAYGRLAKPSSKAAKNYQKYLGKYVSKAIKKHLKGFEPPVYAATSDYVRTGATIVLLADDEYYKNFPQNPSKVFVNHLHPAYFFLLNKLSLDPGMQQTKTALNGTWELNYIPGEKIDFEGLYPGKKPFIKFDTDSGKITGNTGCNSFTGPLNIDGAAIHFSDGMAMTKMLCPGEGEQIFLNMLKKITSYSIEENTLSLLMDDVTVMRFERK